MTMNARTRLRRLLAPPALALLAGAASLALALPGMAETRRALLVGVSDYPKEAVGDLQLTGPKNDVALMIETLPRLGFAEKDMTVLADGLDQTEAKRKADGQPTRAAILAGLEKLAKESAPGDHAFVFLSGHGSRQPDLNPDKRPFPKPDGLDEIFLPIDIGPWDDGVASVKNALLDFELGQAITRIRARGAHVWVVIDACHSGTMTRSADAVAKQVPTDRLRVPQAALDKAKAAAAARAAKGGTRSAGGAASPFGALPSRFEQATTVASLAAPAAAPASASAAPSAGKPAAREGAYVAFFAAYPDQAALQRALPKSYGGAKKPHGVLTFYLAQAVRAGGAATYRDLAHRVLAGYEMFGAKAPTPMFEGDLQLPFPGAEAGGKPAYAARRKGEELTLAAGAVDGFAPGALLALAAAEEPGKTLGHARIETAETARATLKPASFAGKETALKDLPDDSALIATVVEKGVELAFRVARPPEAAASEPGELAVRAALAAMAGAQGGPVELVAAGQPADMSLRLQDGRLWFVGEDGRFETKGRAQTISLPLDSFGAEEAKARPALERALGGLAKARNLIRVATAMPAGAVADKLKIEAFLLPALAAAPASARAPDDRACGPLERDRLPADATRFADLVSAGEATPDLKHCDVVYFKLTNAGDKPIDVTPLYVDGGGGVAYMGPPTGLRLEPRAAPFVFPVRIVTFDQKRGVPFPIGQERLLFIAVEMTSREALPADFRYLAQPTLTAQAARGGGGPLRSFLEAAAFAGKSRAASAPASGGGAAGVADFRWNVRAPDGVE
ncbi:MAG: caspase family protein [Rhizobiales bacterium]|nr:caspase family protein [Hyphomicrobiales bacterium]